MTDGMLLALAQLNPVMGDIVGNIQKLSAVRNEAAKKGTALVVTPELYISGYPPEDLVLKPSFQKTTREAVEKFAAETADGGPAVLLGTPWIEQGKLYNAALLIDRGQIVAKIFKNDLPNYGPFDEKRVFAPGGIPSPVDFRGHKLGIMVCEDMWKPEIAKHLRDAGAEILVVPNGSPYETAKQPEREILSAKRVAETGLPLLYLNQIGGQDELVFDGSSFVMNANGRFLARAKSWEEDILYISLPLKENSVFPAAAVPKEETIYNALLLGLRDYVQKNSFPGVVLGLSGGIDSALVAALAVDALGPENVWCVMLPSVYTSEESFEDAKTLAGNLKCRYDIMPITDAIKAFDGTLSEAFKGQPINATEENIQARCRGIILMALSNKFGAMVLSTGNKSEMSVGYSTLYGDLCGGFAVLKDLYKSDVYRIAQWRNEHKPATAKGGAGVLIPERIFTKAPTAELRPNQKDQDSLPPYDELDDILEGLIEKDLGVHEIVARGHSAELVARVWSMLDRAEYKRRQAPPGVKVTRRALGKDRRYPITNRYKED